MVTLPGQSLRSAIVLEFAGLEGLAEEATWLA